MSDLLYLLSNYLEESELEELDDIEEESLFLVILIVSFLVLGSFSSFLFSFLSFLFFLLSRLLLDEDSSDLSLFDFFTLLWLLDFFLFKNALTFP